MNRQTTAPWPQLLALATTLLAAAPVALAADGQILINQAKAMAGGVTPGDAPGFPVTISQPGSYKLVGNLTVPNENTTAVEITGNDVTLDLNGFAIMGPTVCPYSGGGACAPLGTGVGVLAEAIVNPNRFANGAIQNGTIRGMGSRGILVGGATPGTRIDRIRAVSNGSDGISASIALVTNSLALNNGDDGISGEVVNVQGSVAQGNRGYGLHLNVASGLGSNLLVGNTLGEVAPGSGVQTSGNVCGIALCP
jgi:hypothetical protein